MMKKEIQKLGHKILHAAGSLPLQIFIRQKRGALVRFTNNGVHQNGFQDLLSYTLRWMTENGPIYLESNDFSETAIRRAVQSLSKEKSKNKLSSSFSKKKYPAVREAFPFNVRRVPEMAAQAIGEAVSLIRRRQASANGYYSAYERSFYWADTSGRELFHPATAVRFGLTAIKGSGKGYQSVYQANPKKLKIRPVVEEALQLAEGAAQNEIQLPAGEYPCIFHPRAFLEFIEPLRRHFDARFASEGKSVFSGQLGKKLFSPHLTLKEDLEHPGQFGVPFDAEGDPKPKVILAERGVLKDLLGEGHSTRGICEHPFDPQNLVVERGKKSLREMMGETRRGIFINKIWYHALVREESMEVTGLATAGSVLIENGRCRGRVVHLRYHDSILSLLDRIVGASREQILLKDGEMGAALFPYLQVSRLRIV